MGAKKRFKKIFKKMTKAGYCGCPERHGFKNDFEEECVGISCVHCWGKVIRENKIKFKKEDK